MLAGQHAGLKGFRQNLDDMLDLDIGAFSATNTVPKLHDTSRTGCRHAISPTRHNVSYFAGLDLLGQVHVRKTVGSSQPATGFRMSHFPYRSADSRRQHGTGFFCQLLSLPQ